MSAIVFEGVVVDQHSRWEDGIIVTRSVVEGNDGRVVVRHLGGAIDGIGQIAFGDAWLSVGEGVRLALEWSGEWGVAGGEHGKAVAAVDESYYVRTTTRSANPPCGGDEAHPLYWDQVTVPYVLDAAGSDDLTQAETFATLRASFATWEAIECSYLSFREAGVVTGVAIGYDQGGSNHNAVKFVEAGWPGPRTAIALTLNTFECATGRIVDADIIFNGQEFRFTTTGGAAMDLENTATHEVGHLVGFDHTPDPESTMFDGAREGETLKRDLTADDVAGMCDVYALGSEPDDSRCGCGSAPTPALLSGLIVLAFTRRRGRGDAAGARRARRPG
jgi:hypothetical protein